MWSKITVITGEGSLDRVYELDDLGRLKDKIAPQARRTLKHVTRARIAERQAAVMAQESLQELVIKQTEIPNEHIDLADEATRAIPSLGTGVVTSENCSGVQDWEPFEWDLGLLAIPVEQPMSTEIDFAFFN
jgi:hypothetical protein